MAAPRLRVVDELEHDFTRLGDGRYQLTVDELSTDFEVNHVRRERFQLYGEVTVFCSLAGVKTYDRVLFTAAINFSTLRDREHLARALATATNTDVAIWTAIINELSTRVKRTEDIGLGAVNLRDVPKPVADQFYRVGRLLIPMAHPSLFFGDGDALKTYTGLYLLKELRRQGARVGIADWELTEADHRDRGERLEGDAPDTIYIPCTKPLVYEADRITRAIHDHQLTYLLLDSAAPACNGRPEDAEIASAYFRALRAFGIGTTTIAHANRSEQSDQKPFGSVFWYNLARAIWYVKRGDPVQDGCTDIGLYPRKFNLGPPQRPTAFRFAFSDTATTVTPIDIADIDSLAKKLPLKDRIAHLLRGRARSVDELAAELSDGETDTINADTIRRTIRRYSAADAKVKLFTKLPDDRIGLVERWAS
jgi:hypothetical protein